MEQLGGSKFNVDSCVANPHEIQVIFSMRQFPPRGERRQKRMKQQSKQKSCVLSVTGPLPSNRGLENKPLPCDEEILWHQS